MLIGLFWLVFLVWVSGVSLMSGSVMSVVVSVVWMVCVVLLEIC